MKLSLLNLSTPLLLSLVTQSLTAIPESLLLRPDDGQQAENVILDTLPEGKIINTNLNINFNKIDEFMDTQPILPGQDGEEKDFRSPESPSDSLTENIQDDNVNIQESNNDNIEDNKLNRDQKIRFIPESPEKIKHNDPKPIIDNINYDNCNDINLNYNTPAKKIAVTSFPGSGNTWMRHLLHMSTGFHTGSIYHDGKLKEKGFLGEALDWDDDRVVGIKLHKMGYLKKLATEKNTEMTDLMQKAVLLIRSPYRALMSEFNRVNNAHHLHVGKADISAFKNGTWDKFLDINIEKWQSAITAWTDDYAGDVHVVCYEDLKENTYNNVEKILDFMEVTFARPNCINQNTDGSFKRKSTADVDIKHYFNSAQREKLEDNIKIVKDSLLAHNHQDCTLLF